MPSPTDWGSLGYRYGESAPVQRPEDPKRRRRREAIAILKERGKSDPRALILARRLQEEERADPPSKFGKWFRDFTNPERVKPALTRKAEEAGRRNEEGSFWTGEERERAGQTLFLETIPQHAMDFAGGFTGLADMLVPGKGPMSKLTEKIQETQERHRDWAGQVLPEDSKGRTAANIVGHGGLTLAEYATIYAKAPGVLRGASQLIGKRAPRVAAGLEKWGTLPTTRMRDMGARGIGTEVARGASYALPLDLAFATDPETSPTYLLGKMDMPEADPDAGLGTKLGLGLLKGYQKVAGPLGDTFVGRAIGDVALGAVADVGLRGTVRGYGGVERGFRALDESGAVFNPRNPKRIRTPDEVDAAKQANIEEFGKITDDLAKGERRTTGVQDLDEDTAIHNLLSGSEKLVLSEKVTIRELGYALQKRALARFAKLTNGEPLDLTKHKDIISDILVDEFQLALKSEGNAAEWYRAELEEAFHAWGVARPEILEDPIALEAARFSLAITSNGIEVADNATYARMVHDAYIDSSANPLLRRFPEDLGWGKSATAMKTGFTKWNRLADEIGVEQLLRLMDTPTSVKELNSLGLKVSGEAATEILPASVMFGPKVGGGFYRNLGGWFDTVTMDRWFRRTMGRITGDLMQKPTDKAIASAKKDFTNSWADNPLGGKAPKTDDELLVAARDAKREWEKLGKDPEGPHAGYKDKPKWAKSAERVISNLDPTIREAPAGAGERTQLREVLYDTQRKLKEATGIDYDVAQIQAGIWYPEKRLYDQLGIRGGAGDISYADAFKMQSDIQTQTGKGTAYEARRSADDGVERGGVGEGRRLAGPESTEFRAGYPDAAEPATARPKPSQSELFDTRADRVAELEDVKRTLLASAPEKRMDDALRTPKGLQFLEDEGLSVPKTPEDYADIGHRLNADTQRGLRLTDSGKADTLASAGQRYLRAVGKRDKQAGTTVLAETGEALKKSDKVRADHIFYSTPIHLLGMPSAATKSGALVGALAGGAVAEANDENFFVGALKGAALVGGATALGRAVIPQATKLAKDGIYAMDTWKIRRAEARTLKAESATLGDLDAKILAAEGKDSAVSKIHAKIAKRGQRFDIPGEGDERLLNWFDRVTAGIFHGEQVVLEKLDELVAKIAGKAKPKPGKGQPKTPAAAVVKGSPKLGQFKGPNVRATRKGEGKAAVASNEIRGSGLQAQVYLDTELKPLITEHREVLDMAQVLTTAERRLELYELHKGIKGAEKISADQLTESHGAIAALQKLPEWEQIFRAGEAIKTFYRNLLDMKYEAGVLTKAQYKAIVARGEFYIPFVSEKIVQLRGTPTVGESAYKALTTADVRKMTEHLDEAIHVNAFEQAVVDTHKTFLTMRRSRLTNIIARYGRLPELKKFIKPLREKPVDGQGGLKAHPKGGAYVPTRNKKGTLSWFDVTDPDLAKAWSSLGIDVQDGAMLRSINAMRKFEQAGITYNPIFIPVNAIRDYLTSAAQIRLNEGMPLVGSYVPRSTTQVGVGALAGAALAPEDKRLQGAVTGIGILSVPHMALHTTRVVGAMHDLIGPHNMGTTFGAVGGYFSNHFDDESSYAKMMAKIMGGMALGRGMGTAALWKGLPDVAPVRYLRGDPDSVRGWKSSGGGSIGLYPSNREGAKAMVDDYLRGGNSLDDLIEVEGWGDAVRILMQPINTIVDIGKQAGRERTGRSAWNLFRSMTLDPLGTVGIATEQASRLAMFKHKMRTGGPKGETRAAADARIAKEYEVAMKRGVVSETMAGAQAASRDVSLDFSVSGTYATIQTLNKSTLFLNPTLRGLHKLGRLAKDPEVVTTAGAIMVAPTMMNWYLNHSDPEVAEEYANVPQYTRNSYWLISKKMLNKIGMSNETSGFYKIPKPFELGYLFASVPERMMDTAHEYNEIGLKLDMAEALGEAGDILLDFRGSFLSPGLPIGIGEWAQANLGEDGYNMFTGRPINPYPWSDLPQSAQYSNYTSTVAMMMHDSPILGDILKFSGFDSPAKVQFLWDSFGSIEKELAHEATKIARDMGWDTRPESSESASYWERRFATNPQTATQPESDFRDSWRLAEERHNEALHLRRTDPAKLLRVLTPDSPDFDREFRFQLEKYDALKKHDKWIGRLTKARREIREHPELDGETKARAIAEMTMMLGTLATMANRELKFIDRTMREAWKESER